MNEHENIIKGLVAVRQLLVAMEAASVGRTPLIENIEAVNRAIEALKPEEPRVMQFSEIMAIYKADPFHVWPYNTPPFLYIQEHPHVRHSSESWAAWREIRDILEGELFGHTAQSYGKTWRCWTRQPNSEQREATPWES